jgi:hypothetical protein
LPSFLGTESNSIPSTTSISGLGIYQQSELHIRKFTYQMFVETSASSLRLYIICPELPVNNVNVPWAVARRVDEIVKFAACVTKTEGIRQMYHYDRQYYDKHGYIGL